MTDQNLTEIIIIMDRSGSMTGIAHEMERGIDGFLERQRDVPGECLVTLIKFDDKYEVAYEQKPIREVPKTRIMPRNTTALLDAVGRTIKDVGSRLAGWAEFDRPARVVVLIITDGQENSSIKYTFNEIKDMIQHQRDVYKWEFVYLGSESSTWQDSSRIGLIGTRYDRYDTQAMFAAADQAIASYRTGASVSVNLPKDLTNGEQ